MLNKYITTKKQIQHLLLIIRLNPCKLLTLKSFFDIIILTTYKGVYTMDALKKLFPSAFKATDVKSLIKAIVIYIVIAIIAGFVMFLAGLLTGWIPVIGKLIGLILKIAGSIVELYVVVGVILSLLKFFKVVE